MDRALHNSNDSASRPGALVALVTDVMGPEPLPELGIRIDREGIWHHEGSPIRRQSLLNLLASALRRGADGSYIVDLPSECGRIEVEDAPFVGVELFTSLGGAGRTVSVRSNMDEIVAIDDDHPLRVVSDPVTGEPAPYVMIRDGLEAKLTRSTFYDLVGLGQEEDTECGRIYGLWSSGRFFPIGRLEDEEAAS